MELKLQKFIQSMSKVVDITDLDDSNPLILLLPGLYPNLAQKYSVMAATVEPVTKLLPINGIWICYDSNSPYYLRALKLLGYGQTLHPSHALDSSLVVTDFPFKNSWQEISTLAELTSQTNISNLVGPQGPPGSIGPTGIRGPVGIAGADATIDYPAIIQSSIDRYLAQRGY